MLDKELIKKNFKKSLLTYDKNAFVQKKMAQKLVFNLPFKKYNNILEIGSYSGILTKEIIKNIDFKYYLALDIIDSFDCIKNLSKKIEFQKTDIETFETEEKFDLIIANASLQWCDDLDKIIKKLKLMLNAEGTLAVSIFDNDNLLEIKKSFNVGLNYLSIDKIKKIFSKSAKIIKEKETLCFNSPKEALLHLKSTGVNSIVKNNLTIGEIKAKMKILDKTFKNTLTYSPLYIID